MTSVMPEPVAIESVGPDDLEKNPHNPRLIFRTDEMEELIDSIKSNGILVPLTVFKSSESGKYRILDGERRWRAATQLNLSKIPVNVIPEPPLLQNILMMFNIHALREQWDLLPMALKLGEVIEITHKNGERELARMTGLRPGTVRRCRRILAIPEDYREKIMRDLARPPSEREYTEDLFLEVMAAISVIDSRLPHLVDKLGRDDVIASLVEKKVEGVIGNTTDYRQLAKLVRTIDRGVDVDQVANAIEDLVQKEDAGVVETYERIAGGIYEAEALIRTTRQLLGSLRSIVGNRVEEDYREDIVDSLTQLREEIDRLLTQIS